jgi:hypothetical protein
MSSVCTVSLDYQGSVVLSGSLHGKMVSEQVVPVSFSFSTTRNNPPSITDQNSSSFLFQVSTDNAANVTAFSYFVCAPQGTNTECIGLSEYPNQPDPTTASYEVRYPNYDPNIHFDPEIGFYFVGVDQWFWSSNAFPAIESTLSVSEVPIPNVGAGLPGLIIVCGGVIAWHRRKRQGSQKLAA